MSEKIDELLAVLDLPKNEQINYLYRERGYDTDYDGSLADLAFRLRDEAGLKFPIGAKVVYEYMEHRDAGKWRNASIKASLEEWYCCQEWILYKPPIYFIIASLIAKELEDENG